jgi:hypothetical protein
MYGCCLNLRRGFTSVRASILEGEPIYQKSEWGKNIPLLLNVNQAWEDLEYVCWQGLQFHYVEYR